MRYLVGMFLGVLLTFTGALLYSKNTYVAMSCDVTKYSPQWSSLYETLQYIYDQDTGINCWHGAFIVKAPDRGQMTNIAIESLIKNQYDIKELHPYYRNELECTTKK